MIMLPGGVGISQGRRLPGAAPNTSSRILCEEAVQLRPVSIRDDPHPGFSLADHRSDLKKKQKTCGASKQVRKGKITGEG